MLALETNGSVCVIIMGQFWNCKKNCAKIILSYIKEHVPVRYLKQFLKLKGNAALPYEIIALKLGGCQITPPNDNEPFLKIHSRHKEVNSSS